MKKRLSISLALIVAIPVLFFTFLQTPEFGARPSSADKQRFVQSAAFNQEKGIFENRRPSLVDERREDGSLLEAPAFHTWYEPVATLARLADERGGVSLVTPLLGEVLVINGDTATNCWWESIN